MSRPLCLTSILLLLLLPLSICVGSVSLPLESIVAALSGSLTDDATYFIVMENRLPQSLTAVLTGATLAVVGLVMQTLFHNPLADPSLLGVGSGASLGAAVALLVTGGTLCVSTLSAGPFLLTVAAALCGAGSVIALLMLCCKWLHSELSLLVTGVMISFAVSALISLLSFYATADGLQQFILWSFGSFAGVRSNLLALFALLTILPLILILGHSRALDALLLGNDYAANLGIRVKATRNRLLLLTGLLVAVVTALCGPIAFIGLAVPHIARLLTPHGSHRHLLPLTLICGADIALIALMLTHLPGARGIIPLAAITPLLGVPVVIYILLKHRA